MRSLSTIERVGVHCSSIRHVSSLHWKSNNCPFSNFCPLVLVSNEDRVTSTADRNFAPGLILHKAALYDMQVWLFTLGRESGFREKILRLARLEPGEAILDVGCGTGTLAIAAKRHVGPTGSVCGIDASPQMIARANRKARKAGVEIVFNTGAAQAIPFSDACFDVVLNTLMLHHLPRKARQQCASEMRRVVKPGGRVLAVDFGERTQKSTGPLGRFHRHGGVSAREIVGLLSEAGFQSVESGLVGTRGLQFGFAKAASGL